MIRRSPRPERGFLILDNHVARDDRLSYRALGLLVLILSRPDNWRIDRDQLARGEGREGVTAIRTALKELESGGYMVRRRVKVDGGRFAWDHVVYDKPQVRDIPAGHTTGQVSTDGIPTDGIPPSLEDHHEDPQEDGMERGAPADAVDPTDVGFEDWRATDRALFRDLVEGQALTSDGSGPWGKGTWSVDAWYDAFRKWERAPKKWPGLYFEAMGDRLDDFLLDHGLEVA